MDLPDIGASLAPIAETGSFLVRHPVLISASAAALGALWVYHRRENLNVVRNFWAVLEEDDGLLWFRFYSEADAYLWNMFPNDPIMRWRLRRAARSTSALTADHPGIDYIPWTGPTARLVSLLRGHISSTPLQWYDNVSLIFGSSARPHAILLAEQYPNGADMTWRNVLLHPGMFDELLRLKGKTREEIETLVHVDSKNHYDLLMRLIELADIIENGEGDSAQKAFARINMSTIRVPGSELTRAVGQMPSTNVCALAG